MLVDIHTHSPSSNHICIQYSRQPLINDQYHFSAGIHPWDAHLYQDTNLDELFSSIFSHKNFFTLGEIGIDLIKKENLELQKTIFLQQLKLAKESQIKIILIHCVKSLNEILKLLKESQYSGQVIFHDANFNTIETELIINMGHFLSFGNNLFKDNSKAQQTIHSKWIKHYFFETDDSKRNIQDVYQQACSVMGISMNFLEEQTLKNFHRINQ